MPNNPYFEVEFNHADWCRIMDREFEEAQCSQFDDRMYRFMCREDKEEADAHFFLES